MKIWIVSGPAPDWSAYLGELLRAWGLAWFERVPPAEIARTAPAAGDVWILPPGTTLELETLESCLQAGGKVVGFAPNEALLRLLGLQDGGEQEGSLRLRLTQPLAVGALGQTLPLAGPARALIGADPAAVWAYLYAEERYDSESPALVVRPVGPGQVALFAFHLPLSVARLRQGDPERVGKIPEGDAYPRPCHLFVRSTQAADGWVPFADLQALLFCDLVRHLLEPYGPVPSLWPLPEGAPSLLIYSGDEDGGAPEMDEVEMRDLEAQGGTMSLYVFPDHTGLTPEAVAALQARGHTISVHPNLAPVGSADTAVQLARARAQVELFVQRFGVPVRTVRNHSCIWPGYLEMAELWEELGIRMDANFAAVSYKRSREWAPYVGLGGALPLPFVRLDGGLIGVWQQPTHVMDDVGFHPEVDYSLKLRPAQFEVILRRALEDACRSYHTPFCVCIHPINYVRYSGEQGRLLMQVAREQGMPLWSVDRWLNFWEARSTWNLSAVRFQDGRLSFRAAGQALTSRLAFALPARARGAPLARITADGHPTPFIVCSRFRRETALMALPPGTAEVDIAAEYPM
jgi:hypothetical protein